MLFDIFARKSQNMIIISKPILLKGIVTEAEIWKALIILFDFCLAHI